MKTLRTILLSATTLALAGISSAQSVGTSYHRAFGSTFAGGYFHADAGLSMTNESYVQDEIPQNAYSIDGGTNLHAGVTLFWRSLEAFRFQANGSLDDDTGSLSGTTSSVSGLVRVGGYTLYNINEEHELTTTRSFGPYNVFPGNLTAMWWLGPVPLTASANAGSGAAINLQLNANPFEHQVRVTTTPRAWQYGWASAGVGVYGFSAGIHTTLTLANTSLSFPLIADLEDGLSGYMAFTMHPIAIWLRLYATVNLWFWHQTWYLTLYSWSAGAITSTYQLL